MSGQKCVTGCDCGRHRRQETPVVVGHERKSEADVRPNLRRSVYVHGHPVRIDEQEGVEVS